MRQGVQYRLPVCVGATTDDQGAGGLRVAVWNALFYFQQINLRARQRKRSAQIMLVNTFTDVEHAVVLAIQEYHRWLAVLGAQVQTLDHAMYGGVFKQGFPVIIARIAQQQARVRGGLAGVKEIVSEVGVCGV